MDTRQAFEAWHSLVHAPGYPQMVSMKNPDGTYVYIESEWKAWQAATLAAKQQAGVIVLKDGRSVPVMADFKLTMTGGGGGGGSGGSFNGCSKG